ncbi:unknown [Porcine lymphotropic herpesvirus 2]|uniref:Uncharacterized protein n=1 Tax=Suid gammaherpesvirus 4 TaxID=1960250 RepID=Q8B3U8_9GAMA|nr:unknown [Porcine lymphotropic herpesvirus 2]AAO12386.1 unknown [Porcine lymphotropic herpesvirus 2]
MAMFLKKTKKTEHEVSATSDRLFDLEGAPSRKKTTYFKFPPFSSVVQLAYSGSTPSIKDVRSILEDDDVFYPEGYSGPHDILPTRPKFANPEKDSEEQYNYDYSSNEESFSDIECDEEDELGEDEYSSDEGSSYGASMMESMVSKSLNIVESTSSSDEEDEFVFMRPPIGQTTDIPGKRSRTPNTGAFSDSHKKIKANTNYSEHSMLDTPPIKEDEYNWPWLN